MSFCLNRLGEKSKFELSELSTDPYDKTIEYITSFIVEYGCVFRIKEHRRVNKIGVGLREKYSGKNNTL